jgi:hypothetical protein
MTEQGILEPGVRVVGKPFTRSELLTALSTTLAGPPRQEGGAVLRVMTGHLPGRG